MAAVGAHRLDQPVAALPGAQGDGVDAGEAGDGADREQLRFVGRRGAVRVSVAMGQVR